MLKLQNQKEQLMSYLLATYVIYGLAAIGLTGVLARTLYSHGAIFLDDVFSDSPGMAVAINRLLVTGFYMLNLGYAFLLFKMGPTESVTAATETLVERLGYLLVSLGVIHFINMAVFWKIKRSGEYSINPPTMPSLTIPPPPAPGAGY